MRNIVFIFLLLIFSLAAYPQKNAEKTPVPTPVAEKSPLDEEREFQNARIQTSITDRIAALKKFTEDFPQSDKKIFALELIASSRAELGDQKLRLSDNQSGIELFKLAAAEAPTPVSDKLFTEILVQIPTNLFLRGQPQAAFETAAIIEEKIAGNVNQMLSLAAFYLGTEYASEAKRVAEKVLEIEPASASAYQMLGMANRLNFDLNESAAAYKKALELNPDSIISMRSLAEMKRATGKSEEAVELYRRILEKDTSDQPAQTGLILSLFNTDKITEAEAEMAKTLETNPNNLFLLVGAAYWYAAHNQGSKAIQMAEKAIIVEPRYTWAYIALARGLLQEKRPLEAERALLIARQYGNFPTLNYEIAAVRMNAGFYREAADELKKVFFVNDGIISTNLGGRILKEGNGFIEILGYERRASIFEPLAADDPIMAEKLKSLLKFSRKLDSDAPNESEIAEAADEFVKGEDNMKVHRGLFVANRLLEKRIALSKALEMTEAAVGGVDKGLDVISPAAAVMADELYETRTIAAARNELLLVPDVPRQTLSRILRGRIEELTGQTLLEQGKTEEAAIRFRRAISVLPEKSAWWRSSKWRLGNALETSEKSKEALDAYLESFDVENPSLAKRNVIESLYEKVHGSTDGLDRLIGAKPVINRQETAQIVKPAVTPTPVLTPTPTPKPLVIPENVPIAIEPPKTENTLPTEVQPTPTPVAEKLNVPENVPLITSAEKAEVEEESPIEADIEKKEETPLENLEKKVEAEISVVPPEPTPAPTPQTIIETEDIPTPKIEKDETDKNLPIVEEKNPPTPENPISAETLTEVIEDSEKITEPQPTPNRDSPTENLIAGNTQVSLFEPIIINVPKIDKKPKPEEKQEKVTENSKEQTETKSDETLPEKTAENLSARPRIVSADKVSVENPAQCSLQISQDKLSIINDGGSLGMFVGFEGTGGDLNQIKVKSSSQKDLSIEFQSDIGILTGRAFYIIKSISPKTGIFTVIFESNCGKKEITVTVR